MMLAIVHSAKMVISGSLLRVLVLTMASASIVLLTSLTLKATFFLCLGLVGARIMIHPEDETRNYRRHSVLISLKLILAIGITATALLGLCPVGAKAVLILGSILLSWQELWEQLHIPIG